MVTRDRTARTRIRDYLVEHGPVDDPSGRATSVLQDAISYKGSSVAFIQLIAAMDREDEIVRDVRGKRTYSIAATRVPERVAVRVPGTNGAAARTLTVPVAEAVEATESGALRIDYGRLAHAVVRELLAAAAANPAGDREYEEISADIEVLRAERDRMIAERDEYAQRLRAARSTLEELLGGPDTEPGARPDPKVEA